jgi:hypothetical protein
VRCVPGGSSRRLGTWAREGAHHRGGASREVCHAERLQRSSASRRWSRAEFEVAEMSSERSGLAGQLLWEDRANPQRRRRRRGVGARWGLGCRPQ